MHRTISLIIAIFLLFGGCKSTQGVTQPDSSDVDDSPVISDDSSKIPTPEMIPVEPAVQTKEADQTLEAIQADIDDCYANADHPIGQQIADDYADQTIYTQVMDWFCSGFEFEDILTALQTAEISDFPADILLTMLEYGQTWEEIWIEIGLENQQGE